MNHIPKNISDKIAKRLAAMLPPQIQQAEQADDGMDSPEVQQVKMQAQPM